ncbi:hypothetical protein ACFV23_05175 [Streptomyces sp. NPDC059627]
MTAVTAEATHTNVVRHLETGWARARRLRGHRMRTCLRATLDTDTAQVRQGDEWNVVRGED